MKLKYLIFGLALVVMAMFVACSREDSSKAHKIPDIPLQKWDRESALKKLGFIENEKRFYYLSGSVGGESVEAHVWLDAKQLPIQVRIISRGTQNPDYNFYDNLTFSQVELGVVSGGLVIRGNMRLPSQSHGEEGVKFELSQKIENPLSEVDFIQNTFEASQDVTTDLNAEGEKQILSYSKKVTNAFIPSHNALRPEIQAVLNRSLAQGAKSKEALREILMKDANKGFEELVQDGGGLVVNMEGIEDLEVAYVDDRIVMFIVSQYTYEGGAHGMRQLSTKTYSLQTGEQISQMGDKLFGKHSDELLALLSSKLSEKYKGKLFDESLPLKELPETFYFNPLGVAFVWQPYELASYSDGFIFIDLSYEELKPFVNPDSPYKYLFD